MRAKQQAFKIDKMGYVTTSSIINYKLQHTRQPTPTSMTQCYPTPSEPHCDVVSQYLDITNQIELSCIMILQTIITIMFLYISYHLWKTKIWRNVKGSQQVVIIAIIAMLLATCILFFVSNVIEVELYKMIYYEAKGLEEINALKNIYIVLTSLVPIIINNMYLSLCILWEQILRKCLISNGKKVYRLVGLIAIIYNSAGIAICVIQCLFESGPEISEGIVLKWIYKSLLIFTIFPALLIVFYLRRFMRNLSYVDKRITSKKGFKTIIYSLASVNLFRIFYSIFVPIAVSTAGAIPNLVELVIDEAKCCQRTYYVGYPVFIFCLANILIILPTGLIFTIFNTQEQKEPKENIESMLSERSVSVSQQI